MARPKVWCVVALALACSSERATGGAPAPDAGSDAVGPAVCSASSCTSGCCAGDTCADGTAGMACGWGGATCASCAADQACSNQACAITATVTPPIMNPGSCATLVDDRNIHVQSPDDVARVRRDLVRYVWRGEGYPGTKMPVVQHNVSWPTFPSVSSTATAPSSLDHIDLLTVTMEDGYTANIYHFVSNQPGNRLMIQHGGHGHYFDPSGAYAAFQRLLDQGWSVMEIWMPGYGPNMPTACPDASHCGNPDHDAIIASASPSAAFHPLKFFLEPVVVALNYAQASYSYADIGMLGLSGGGWTTVVAAALDPRIRLSVSVAGSLPLVWREGNNEGDREQCDNGFYALAGYEDLYVLGAAGAGRRVVQVSNRLDGNFGHCRLKLYEADVRAAVAAIGSGSYQAFTDDSVFDATVAHQYSPYFDDAILTHEIAGDGVTIVDDDEPDAGQACFKFSATGTWLQSLQGLAGDIHYANGGPAATATWTFDVTPGTYRVWATWVEFANRPAAAAYALNGAPVSKDQRQAPSGLMDAGRPWTELGDVVATGTSLAVTLNNSSNPGEQTIADGIRIQRIGK